MLFVVIEVHKSFLLVVSALYDHAHVWMPEWYTMHVPMVPSPIML